MQHFCVLPCGSSFLKQKIKSPKFCCMQLNFREAVPSDITQIQVVRNAVQENRLSDPSRVTDNDCLEYMTQRGKGWVCVIEETVVGFAIVDLADQNVWALFVTPAFENSGIGKKLQQIMLEWYFQQTDKTIWLGTAPGTRAETFYRLTGWEPKGLMKNGEMRFELTDIQWRKRFL